MGEAAEAKNLQRRGWWGWVGRLCTPIWFTLLFAATVWIGVAAILQSQAALSAYSAYAAAVDALKQAEIRAADARQAVQEAEEARDTANDEKTGSLPTGDTVAPSAVLTASENAALFLRRIEQMEQAERLANEAEVVRTIAEARRNALVVGQPIDLPVTQPTSLTLRVPGTALDDQRSIDLVVSPFRPAPEGCLPEVQLKGGLSAIAQYVGWRLLRLLTFYSDGACDKFRSAEIFLGLLPITGMLFFAMFFVLQMEFHRRHREPTTFRWPEDSLYYLGFLFTLASLFAAFASMADGQGVSSIPQDRLPGLISSTGTALLTTLFGLVLRLAAEQFYLAYDPGGEGTTTLTSLRDGARDILAPVGGPPGAPPPKNEQGGPGSGGHDTTASTPNDGSDPPGQAANGSEKQPTLRDVASRSPDDLEARDRRKTRLGAFGNDRQDIAEDCLSNLPYSHRGPLP